MKCPTCNVALVMADRNGIEIDYCPNGRGIWLDRSELDKIIERSVQQPSNPKRNNYLDKERYYAEKNNYHNKNKGF
ncbi:zf-TFIIB domain-containing protein [Mariniflexile gromovii]|uniref:Zf-TFIIB domain-containing protein n=1 Tax=Mariniflexile gromovii TaxID=362523 RepID=A0ABS4BVC4_9FLAO|nr:zf-TFIIB domain-containing protein [Mariniflexile gromovii]MBP0904030.1 zf-TFIIB domain-containing protein [Mariniflexile gromovii]